MASEKRNEQYKKYNDKASVYYSAGLNWRTNADIAAALEAAKAAGHSMAGITKDAIAQYDVTEAPEKGVETHRPKEGKNTIFTLKLNRRTDAAVIEKIEAAKARGESVSGYIKRALKAYFGIE